MAVSTFGLSLVAEPLLEKPAEAAGDRLDEMLKPYANGAEKKASQALTATEDMIKAGGIGTMF